MSKFYFIRMTLLKTVPTEEYFWEEGFVCYVTEENVVECYNKLTSKIYNDIKFGRDLLVTVGMFKNISSFDEINDNTKTKTDIVYFSEKHYQSFNKEFLGKVFDPNLDFDDFRSDCVSELKYVNGDFSSYSEFSEYEENSESKEKSESDI